VAVAEGRAGNKAQGDEGEARGVEVALELEEGYRFRTRFGPGMPELLVDEPVPLGEGRGPNASAMLATAVGHCLSASLLYCLRRARVDVGACRTRARAEIGRNERRRLRVTGLDVTLHVGIGSGARARAERCLELFEDFCVVTESVRQGVPVVVHVELEELPVPGGPGAEEA
jgi:uncharacterized OsmC-like protein